MVQGSRYGEVRQQAFLDLANELSEMDPAARPSRPVRYAGEVIGYVWRTEPKTWAFKRAGAMLVGGYSGSVSAAREACIQHWSANNTNHGDKP